MKLYNLTFAKWGNECFKIDLDGSKSISNRLLVLKELSKKETEIVNLSKSDDTVLMQQFFHEFQKREVEDVFHFNVQNAGTVSRFVTAFLATQVGRFQLNCSDEMKRRPIQILVNALRDLGANIQYLEQDGFLPISIEGKKIQGGRIKMNAGVSSQYISALMMIAPHLKNGLKIQLIGDIASKPYLEITQSLMQKFGYQVDFQNQIILIDGEQNSTLPLEILNESDWSAAAFYYTMCSINSDLAFQLSTLEHTSKSAQGDSKVAILFEKLGVKSSFEKNCVHLKHSENIELNQEVDFFSIPDMVPAYVVACAFHGVSLKLTGVRNLAIKESNRLVALKNELAKVGVSLEKQNDDTWLLSGKVQMNDYENVRFKTYEDHRIAMSLACLSVKFDHVEIEHPQVVSKSYPNFWNDMKTIGLKIEERKI